MDVLGTSDSFTKVAIDVKRRSIFLEKGIESPYNTSPY
jgi:hypothetical protein